MPHDSNTKWKWLLAFAAYRGRADGNACLSVCQTSAPLRLRPLLTLIDSQRRSIRMLRIIRVLLVTENRWKCHLSTAIRSKLRAAAATPLGIHTQQVPIIADASRFASQTQSSNQRFRDDFPQIIIT